MPTYVLPCDPSPQALGLGQTDLAVLYVYSELSYLSFFCGPSCMPLVPSKSYVEALPHNVTPFGGRASKAVIKVKRGHRVGPWSHRINVLVRWDIREFTLFTLSLPFSILPFYHMRRFQEDDHLQAWKKDLTKHPLLDLPKTFQPPDYEEKKCLLVRPPRLRYFVMAPWAD